MELTQAFEDRDVRRLLIGGESDDLAEAFTQVETHLRNRFVRAARDRLPGILPEDLADSWQETVRDLLRSVRTRSFVPDRELGPWLWTVFLRRGIDTLRRRARYQEMLQRARERLDGNIVGAVLQDMHEEERIRLLAQVRRVTETFPSRQRTVIQVFVDYFPATEDRKVLRERIAEVTGLNLTSIAVKRAFHEARRKIGNLLGPRQD